MTTAEEVTRRYLYGQDSVPSNLVSDALIREGTVITSVNVNAQTFMTEGAGRFAVGRQFELVNDFFTASSSVLPEGVYSKASIAAIFGLTQYDWVSLVAANDNQKSQQAIDIMGIFLMAINSH